MAKSDLPLDVLILGEHPATYLCAALLRLKTKLRVLHCTIPDEPDPDRLVVINPPFVSLHPLVEGIRRKLDLTALYGLQFLSDDPETHSEFRSKSALAYVTTYKSVRVQMIKVAEGQGVETATPRFLEIHRLDEQGVDVTV